MDVTRDNFEEALSALQEAIDDMGSWGYILGARPDAGPRLVPDAARQEPLPSITFLVRLSRRRPQS